MKSFIKYYQHHQNECYIELYDVHISVTVLLSFCNFCITLYYTGLLTAGPPHAAIDNTISMCNLVLIIDDHIIASYIQQKR